jgi:hypothetical protein
LSQERNPIADINFYIYDLRRAFQSGDRAKTLEFIEKLAQLLGLTSQSQMKAGFETFKIAKRTWLTDTNYSVDRYEKNIGEFLSRHPHMKTYDVYASREVGKDPTFDHEFDWWDQIAKESILENTVDHFGLVKSANEKRLQESMQIRSHVLLKVIGPIIHYTPIENIPSIIENGIVSVSESKVKDLKVVKNDNQRLDNLLNWISTSIMRPNYAYMHSIKARDPLKQFAIIELDPKLLWTHDWIAFPTNAAAKESQSLLLNDPSRLMGLNGLINLFKDGISRDRLNPAKISRSSYSLSDNEPTDPQAEVMFFREIPSNFIKRIHFEVDKDQIGISETQIRKMVAKLPNIYEFKSQKYFMRPEDYSWQYRKIDPTALGS